MYEIRRVIGRITIIENIAVGGRIRELARIRKLYGSGRRRKVKGAATVELTTGEVRLAEIHWYEAHGIGKKLMKVKRFPD